MIIITPWLFQKKWEEVRSRALRSIGNTAAGVDVSYRKEGFQSSLVVLGKNGMIRLKQQGGISRQPYRSGLFFLKEGPIISQIIEGEGIDLLFVNGHGLSHPYSYGIATVIGFTHAIPTIGVAKKLLRGDYIEHDTNRKGTRLVTMRGKPVCLSVTRQGLKKPVYISQGFGITIEETYKQYMQWSTRYKFPEPLRLAHLESRKQCIR